MAEVDDAYMESLVAERAQIADMYEQIRDSQIKLREAVAEVREIAHETREEARRTNGRVDQIEKDVRYVTLDWFGPDPDHPLRGQQIGKRAEHREMYEAHRNEQAVKRFLIAIASFFGFAGLAQIATLVWFAARILGTS